MARAAGQEAVVRARREARRGAAGRSDEHAPAVAAVRAAMGDEVVFRAMNATAATALRNGIARVLPTPWRLRSGLPAVALAAPAAAWIAAVAALLLFASASYH